MGGTSRGSADTERVNLTTPMRRPARAKHDDRGDPRSRILRRRAKIVDKDGSATEESLHERVRTVLHGALCRWRIRRIREIRNYKCFCLCTEIFCIFAVTNTIAWKDPVAAKAWLAAGIRLGNDPTASVSCPNCGKANLLVADVLEENSLKFERIMRCPNCGSRNILLMTRKEAPVVKPSP